VSPSYCTTDSMLSSARCQSNGLPLSPVLGQCAALIWPTLRPGTMEPEVGLEPTTCALRGGSTDFHSIPLSPVLSRSVLITRPSSRPSETHGD
jgi:hypothetical protein